MKTGLMMASSVALCMMLGAAACRPAQKKGSDESLVSERTFKGSPNAGESQSGKIVSVKAVAPLARESSPDGYLAAPPDGKGRPVLVLHAWWGLNDTTRDFCRRLADAGFVAFAPDLYHGKVADTIADAETLARALDGKQARADIAEATRFLTERAGQADRGLAVVGFSLGAYYALDLSVTDPEHVRSVVVFYGTRDGDYSRSQAAYLGHFAETDEFEPQSGVDALEAALQRAGRPVSFHRYPGTGHWFFEPDREQAFNQEAASLAWDRTLAFLSRHSR
ncbi:MAG TPA: dienelactone hydrolase family protein [Thermoanaerobaculia bacterium]|nr:dienelactone hydrolase family protein [Thermoanaerobaculia bacterium]